MATPRKRFLSSIKAADFDDETLDRCSAAYDGEWNRWCWRRKATKDGFELVRNSSPNNDIVNEDFVEIVNLTKRECRDKIDAEAWLGTYRGRAAMAKALDAL